MFAVSGSAPFENPTGMTNFLSIVLMLAIPVEQLSGGRFF
jgi:K+-transporting ATPase A subunit